MVNFGLDSDIGKHSVFFCTPYYYPISPSSPSLPSLLASSLPFLLPFYSPFSICFRPCSLGLICFMPWKPKKSNKRKRQLTAARKARWDVVRKAQAPQQDEVQQEEERKDEDTSSSYAQVFLFSLPYPFGLNTTLSFCFSYPFCFCAASSGCEQSVLPKPKE